MAVGGDVGVGVGMGVLVGVSVGVGMGVLVGVSVGVGVSVAVGVSSVQRAMLTAMRSRRRITAWRTLYPCNLLPLS